MNLKGIFGCAFVAFALIATVPVDSGCGPINPCGSGQQECPDGTCAPSGYTCCGGGTSCPPNAPICGAGNSCLSSYNPAQGCLSQGQEACHNNDGTVDCAPLGAACCGNHRWCPVGTVCNSSGTGCVQ